MYRFGFVMEQTLGHVTHTQNLMRWAAEAQDIEPTWLPVKPDGNDRWERFPVVKGNWSLKASLRAKDAMNAAFARQLPDALFLHTQTVSLYSAPYLRRVPSIISLDATPINYDTVGEAYGHTAGSGWLEKRKFAWYCSLVREATALVTWCQWAKDSLVNDYGIDAQKVTVIPPGVDMANWGFGKEKVEKPIETNRPVRLLFVGGDFERKGGKYLIEAFKKHLHHSCTLDIATRDAVAEEEAKGVEGIRVHRGLTANSEPLKALYANADIFVFPTLADCLPIAVMEGMAAGLPVVATDVGGLSEEVVPGVSGLVVPPKSSEGIVEAVCALVHDPEQRHRMARSGRELAETRFNAQTNYNAVFDLMRGLAKKA